jgi:hypothetical protein
MNRNSTSASNNSTGRSGGLSISERKIQFKPTIQIREYIDHNPDESQRGNLWYTDEEYDEIEASNTKLVQQLMMMNERRSPNKSSKGNRRTLHHQLKGHTERGLEKMTPNAWDRTKDIRDGAFNAVFREQARQHQQRIYDPLAISTVYQRACLQSKREATDSGLCDERFICQEFGPLEPTGIKLSAYNFHDKYYDVNRYNNTSHGSDPKNAIQTQGIQHRHDNMPTNKKPDPD